MPSLSKMVEDREKSASSVSSAAIKYRAHVIQVVSEKLGAEAGQAAGVLLTACAAVLGEHATAMSTADTAHNVELSDDDPVRAERNKLAVELHDKLVEDRDRFRTIGGPAYVKQLGFQGDTDPMPIRVLGLARMVEKQLREVPAPKSRLPGYDFDPKAWADGYVEPIAKLAAAIDKVQGEVREGELTLVAKEKAIAAYDDLFSRSATLVSALLKAGGEDKLAGRVRPSSLRRGVTTGVEEGDDGEIPEPTPAPKPELEPA